MDERETFSDAQVREILERAADRQEDSERALARAGQNLTLADVKEIAHEVGIDPSHVVAAAREVRVAPGTGAGTTWVGHPVELRDARALPAVLDDAEWERLVTHVREVFGVNGIATDFGDIREWVSTSRSQDAMPVQLRVEPGDEDASVTLRQNVKALTATQSLVSGILGIFTALFAVLSLTGEVPVGLAAVMGTLALLFFGGFHVGNRWWVNRQTERFGRVLDQAELLSRGS